MSDNSITLKLSDNSITLKLSDNSITLKLSDNVDSLKRKRSDSIDLSQMWELLTSPNRNYIFDKKNNINVAFVLQCMRQATKKIK